MTLLQISSLILLAGVGACAAESQQSDAVAILDPSVRAACDSVARHWNVIAGATVTRSDTILGPDDVMRDLIGDSSPPIADPRSRRTACAVIGFHPKGIDSVSNARLYWPARGWSSVWRLAADGPDGQVQTYQRSYVRCQVEDSHDGGDDSDSTYVPNPFYRQTTLCWQHSRLIVPADTMKGSA
jgi:hypothetical protein